MKATVTGATGFLGAHVARLLSERGDEVRVVYRDPEKLDMLPGVDFKRSRADVLDYDAMRKALRGSDVLFHTAGYVGSSPAELVWSMNARAPRIAVEAAAAEGVSRVVVTSTISAVGTAQNGPATESTEYPENWLGLLYPDSKRQGERDSLETGARLGIDVVAVNPAYVLGVPVDRSQPGENSTRTVGSYLRGRLPAVIDAPMNFVDVADVAAGHLLAAERGRPGERYILGGENSTWPQLVERLAELSGVRHPVLVLPGEVAVAARVREALALPGLLSAQGYELMAQDWRFSSAKAERELGYTARALEETLHATAEWYLELIDAGAFEDEPGSSLAAVSSAVEVARRLGLLTGIRAAQSVTRRKLVAGL
ncbi:MAG TPA: NAD-dependent epimerase/dehydratase family protein [Thermoleophilaceae bacterium]|nr:NAD-dependent epimerase/dehydratase family protein [Thermoleophilaceae bacterium]